MAENPRIEELRRRVQADPASIAFAALAEEFRRVGRYDEAIETCRTGLQRHPAYLSARVTLGRALIETGDYDGAREELETVLRSAPENLTAIRGLAQIHERLGHSTEMDPHLADMMKTMHAESIRVAAQPPPAPPVIQHEDRGPRIEDRGPRFEDRPPVEPEPTFAPEPDFTAPQEPEPAPTFDLSLAPPLGQVPAPDPDLALTALTLDPEPEMEPPAEPDIEPIVELTAEPDVAPIVEPAEVAAGPDPEMVAMLATVARLERFLGAIQSLRG